MDIWYFALADKFSHFSSFFSEIFTLEYLDVVVILYCLQGLVTVVRLSCLRVKLATSAVIGNIYMTSPKSTLVFSAGEGTDSPTVVLTCT
jgi:hypothetical protein